MHSAADAQVKVVFLNRYFFPDHSATSQMLSDLAFGLAHRGMAVHIICSRQRYDDAKAELPPRERVGGVAVHRVWTTRFGRDRLAGRALDYISFYFSSAWMLIRLLQRGDTVVAKTDPPLISIVAMLAAKLRGARLINWLQDIFPEVAWRLASRPLPVAANAVIGGLRNLTLRAAATNIVLGERMRDFVAQLGVANEQLRIIPNWADLDAATPKRASDSELRTRLELQSAFIVGYSGNLGRAHEFFTMLEAASLLHKDHDIVFLIIGGGASLDALKRAVQQRDLHNFRFLPYQPRESLPDTLAAADVHWLSLLPALEGLIVPSKLYGIFASHRPAIFIGDPDGEAARIIASAQAGIAVAPGNSGLLAEQIARLKSDFNAREIMGQNGYRLYRDRFTAETALAEWTAVLTDQRDSNTSAQRAVKAANVKRPPSSTVDLPRVRR